MGGDGPEYEKTWRGGARHLSEFEGGNEAKGGEKTQNQ